MTSSVELLERARAGSDEALGALVERCAPKLLALIRLRLGPSLRQELESQDLLQATLLKAFTRFDSFAGRDRGSLMAWLARIAENEMRDRAEYRARARRDAALTVGLDDAPEASLAAARVRSQTSRIAQNERLAGLARALESLSPEHRQVIVLRALEERSFGEVGERMGRSAEASRMLFARAMAALTLAMGETA